MGSTWGTRGSEKDLKSPNFFDVAQFPTARFKLSAPSPTRAGKFKLTGDSTMHGVSQRSDAHRRRTLVAGAQAAERADAEIGATATTTLNRRDFGLQYNRMIEAGPVVSDDMIQRHDRSSRRTRGSRGSGEIGAGEVLI